jgi:hypothetical protein
VNTAIVPAPSARTSIAARTAFFIGLLLVCQQPLPAPQGPAITGCVLTASTVTVPTAKVSASMAARMSFMGASQQPLLPGQAIAGCAFQVITAVVLAANVRARTTAKMSFFTTTSQSQ